MEVTKDAEIVEPEKALEQFQQEFDPLVVRARALAVAIKDPASRAEAVDFVLAVEERAAKHIGPLDKARDLQYKAWKAIVNLVNEVGTRRDAVKKTVSAAISAYDLDVERQQRIAEEARLAEIRRLEAEAHKKAEAEAAARAEQSRKEEEARIAHAAEAERLGNAAAPLILETPTPVAPVQPPPMAAPVPAVAAVAPVQPKDDRTTSSDVWGFTQTDFLSVVKAVAAGLAPLSYLCLAETAVRKDVKKLKDKFSCPGIKAQPERRTSFYGNGRGTGE